LAISSDFWIFSYFYEIITKGNFGIVAIGILNKESRENLQNYRERTDCASRNLVLSWGPNLWM